MDLVYTGMTPDAAITRCNKISLTKFEKSENSSSSSSRATLLQDLLYGFIHKVCCGYQSDYRCFYMGIWSIFLT